jgi:hypothetical protein
MLHNRELVNNLVVQRRANRDETFALAKMVERLAPNHRDLEIYFILKDEMVKRLRKLDRRL